MKTAEKSKELTEEEKLEAETKEQKKPAHAPKCNKLFKKGTTFTGK